MALAEGSKGFFREIYGEGQLKVEGREGLATEASLHENTRRKAPDSRRLRGETELYLLQGKVRRGTRPSQRKKLFQGPFRRKRKTSVRISPSDLGDCSFAEGGGGNGRLIRLPKGRDRPPFDGREGTDLKDVAVERKREGGR